MATEFFFNQLDPIGFQRLINAILTARYGEPIRLAPLRGRDGGRDAEMPDGSGLAFNLQPAHRISGVPPGENGIGIFQVKHHRTVDGSPANARGAVIADFGKELARNVLPRTGTEGVSFFFLVTNVPGSREAFEKVDQKRQELLAEGPKIHADVLWGEHVTAWLDQYPQIWPSFPDLFAGRTVPALGTVTGNNVTGVARSYRLALTTQFQRDRVVRFRQIELEEKLTSLFIDLDLALPEGSAPELKSIFAELQRRDMFAANWAGLQSDVPEHVFIPHVRGPRVSCMHFFGSEVDSPEDRKWPRKILIEGGPGQGKSTLTQMLAQIYRSILIGGSEEYALFCSPARARLPFRIELRLFAEWLKANDATVEQYIVQLLSKDAGGATISVEDLQALIEGSSALVIFDGLDEVGSDELRDAVLTKISECVERLEALDKRIRVLLTTRPPAIAGKGSRLPGFVRVQLLPLEVHQVDEYVQKWTAVFCTDPEDQERVANSFNKRRNELHVNALAKNPMQLSVLLQFIRLKGEAFPDRRAELYRDYFRTVIDRDVEKTPRLLSMRLDIEALHEVIGFKIHSLAESDKASSSLSRPQLIAIVEDWLRSEGRQTTAAQELFRLGEERLGLIIAVAGEAGETRYGFEIQPVREYFAAAYINERISGNAHDFFQEMVRRPFWREVALFLAGLRRANEKADLLLRAKALDEDAKYGWRQDGTSTILELLQEGVLASPGHVHRDAVSFVLRLIDPTDKTPKNEPRALLTGIPNLVRNCGAQVHTDQLRTFLSSGLAIEDRGALDRLHRVAYKLLDSDFLSKYLSALPATVGLLSAEAHISWPRPEKLDLHELSTRTSFWPSVPDPQWAAVWFRAVESQQSKACLAATPVYHQLLVEQFTFSSLRSHFRANRGECASPPPSKWSIWWLKHYLQNLCRVLSGRPASSVPAAPLPDGIEYFGVDSRTAQALCDLLGNCAAAILSLAESSDSTSITGLLQSITNHLADDGLAGWVACRCAVSLLEVDDVRLRPGYMRSIPGSERGEFHYFVRTPRANRLFSHLRRSNEWKEVRQALTPFFREAIKFDVDEGGRSQAGRIVRERLSDVCPTHIRIDGEMKSVLDELLHQLRGERAGARELLDALPIPQWWFRTLISRSDVPLSSLLVEISRRHTFRGPHVPLSAQVMQRVAALARRSSDSHVLSGSLVCLMGSSFWSFTDDSLLLKMIEADAKHADVATRLFDIRFQGNRHMDRLLGVAKAILNGEVVVSRNTGTAAAAYCAQNLPVNFQPLTSAIQTGS